MHPLIKVHLILNFLHYLLRGRGLTPEHRAGFEGSLQRYRDHLAWLEENLTCPNG